MKEIPRFSATWAIVRLESTSWARTSIPWSISEFAASASFVGSFHVSRKMTCTVALGFTDRAPIAKALIPRIWSGIGWAST
jgi:hypothetical protein